MLTSKLIFDFSDNWQNLCQEIGMSECEYKSNTVDISNIVSHLERAHKFTIVEYEGLLSLAKYLNKFTVGPPPDFSFQRSDDYMRPVVLKNKLFNYAFAIIPTVIPPGDTISFNAIYIEGKKQYVKSQDKVMFEIEYCFRKNTWEGNVSNLETS